MPSAAVLATGKMQRTPNRGSVASRIPIGCHNPALLQQTWTRTLPLSLRQIGNVRFQPQRFWKRGKALAIADGHEAEG